MKFSEMDSPKDILIRLLKLKPHKAPGVDGVMLVILREIALEISQPLSGLFKVCNIQLCQTYTYIIMKNIQCEIMKSRFLKLLQICEFSLYSMKTLSLYVVCRAKKAPMSEI